MQYLFTKCPDCKKVIRDSAREYQNLSIPMPCCGSIDSIRTAWPHQEVYDFLRLIRDQSNNPDGRRIQIIFLCTVLEVLLESAIWEVATNFVTERETIKILLDGYRGRERRITLFKKLSGFSLSSCLNSPEHKDFMRKWKDLVELRNKLIHGQYHGLDKRTTLIDYLSRESLSAFTAVNNKIHSNELTK